MTQHLMRRRRTYAKGFAAMGAMFAGSECVVEKIRAKHDIYNAGGCSRRHSAGDATVLPPPRQ